MTRPGAPAPPLESDEELVAGRRPVEEAFAAGRPARRLLVTPQRRQALERIVLHATTLRIPIVEVEGGSLTALAGFDGHQGVAVVVETRRFASVEEIVARSIERKDAAFVLVLDSLEDPQNVGTLLRSAEAAGVHGVVFPTERQAPLTPAAVKASAGATEHLLLAPVDDLLGALTDLHLRGLQIVGSDADAALTAREADLRGPIAIVVGSEGHGLSPAVRRRCDLFVRIPMRGSVGSLNAAVAGSIVLFEALGQRDPGARPDPEHRPPARASKPAAPRSAPSAAPTVEPAGAAAGERSAWSSPLEPAGGPGPEARPLALAEAADQGSTASPASTETEPPATTAPRKRASRKAAPEPPEALAQSIEAEATASKAPRKRASRTVAIEAPEAPSEAAEIETPAPGPARKRARRPAPSGPAERVAPAADEPSADDAAALLPDDAAALLPDDTAPPSRPKRKRA